MPGFVPVVYSGGAPVLSSGGSQRVACAHLAEWLVAYDALQVARGRGHVTYFQTLGGADASAGTHTCGSAVDMAYTGNAPILDAREMGGWFWPRLHRLGWVGGEHVHGGISCGDNACNGYQYAAWLNGYNGLGLNGVGAGDPLPLPVNLRTWQQGIIWAHAEIARLTTPTITEDDMPRLRLDTQGTGWFLTDRGAVTIDSTEDAKVLRRVIDAKDYLVAEDRVLPGEIAVYQKYLARANGAAAPTTTTVTAVLDPAALNAAFDAALANVAFTTRKA